MVVGKDEIAMKDLISRTLKEMSGHMAGHRVEVCMEFNGRTSCRTTSAASEEFAERTAVTNACSDLASGVTETMACERATPVKVTILK